MSTSIGSREVTGVIKVASMSGLRYSIEQGWMNIKPVIIVKQPQEKNPKCGDWITMACCAIGIEPSYTNVQRRWPFLKQSAMSCCQCEGLLLETAIDVLNHVWDLHVRANGDWTKQQFLDLVDRLSVETGPPL